MGSPQPRAPIPETLRSKYPDDDFIPLTKGQVAIVDPYYSECLGDMLWGAHWDRHTRSFYARREDYSTGVRTRVWMHRAIAEARPGEFVDHINHNPLDNRRSNLRVCSNTENMRGRGLFCNNTSGYKGVSVEKSTNSWRAYINGNGKRIHIGTFPTALEAALAYDEAAIKYFGEYALTNASLGLLATLP